MCGIAVMLRLSEARADKAALERMTASLRHRGPDGDGMHIAGSVGLGFRRLSIEHRAVIVLVHYLDLPVDVAAEALGVPVGTVRSRLHHAMRGYRAAIEADLRPAEKAAAR